MNMLHIYLFKGLNAQSVGLRYSLLFLFLLFLCHFWQLVVDPTVTNWKRKSGAGIWCQKPEGGPAMPTDREALFLRKTKAGRENSDRLKLPEHTLPFYSHISASSDSVCFFCFLKKEKKAQWASTIWSGAFSDKENNNKKAFHSPVICATQTLNPCVAADAVYGTWWLVYKKRLKWTKKSRTHCLDLSCISRPDIDLSLGLKRLSTTHTHTQITNEN